MLVFLIYFFLIFTCYCVWSREKPQSISLQCNLARGPIFISKELQILRYKQNKHAWNTGRTMHVCVFVSKYVGSLTNTINSWTEHTPVLPQFLKSECISYKWRLSIPFFSVKYIINKFISLLLLSKFHCKFSKSLWPGTSVDKAGNRQLSLYSFLSCLCYFSVKNLFSPLRISLPYGSPLNQFPPT